MKNKLYVYGDSFAMSYNDKRDWTELVADKLNLDIVNEAQAGLGNIQLFERWLKHFDSYKENDIIVIVLTSPQRSYFWKNAPMISQGENLLDENTHTKYYLEQTLPKNQLKEIYKHKNLLFDYHLFLHNSDNINYFVLSWLHWLDSFSKERGVKVCVLTAFNDMLNVMNYGYKNLLLYKYPLLSIETVEKNIKKYFTHLTTCDPVI